MMESEFRFRQLSIFTCLFFGYACYAYNRKAFSQALPTLLDEGMSKNTADVILEAYYKSLCETYMLLSSLKRDYDGFDACNADAVLPLQNMPGGNTVYAPRLMSCQQNPTKEHRCRTHQNRDNLALRLIASSQNMAFAISKFLGGVLSDRISARLLFSSGLLLSGAATLLFSASDSTAIFTLLWFLNGVGQGAGWPACAKVIRQWSPPEQFGTWWSVLSASTNVSGAVSPFVAAYVILTYGWRASVLLAGSISIGMGVICLVAIINTPADLGWKSYASKPGETSKSNTEQLKVVGKQSTPQETWRDLVTSPFLWLLSLCYMVVFCGKTSAVDWGQMFLMEDLGHSQYVGSAFTSSLEMGGFVGGVASGYITDWLLTRPKTGPGSPRMPVAFLFTAGVAIGLHMMSFMVSSSTSQFLISCLGFFLGLNFYGSISIFGVVAAETAPHHLSGTAHAIVALAANIGAVVSGLPFSYIAKEYNWGAIFTLLEAISVATVLVMLLTWNMRGSIGRSKKD